MTKGYNIIYIYIFFLLQLLTIPIPVSGLRLAGVTQSQLSLLYLLGTFDERGIVLLTSVGDYQEPVYRVPSMFPAPIEGRGRRGRERERGRGKTIRMIPVAAFV